MKSPKQLFPIKFLAFFTAMLLACSCNMEPLEILEQSVVQDPYGNTKLCAQINLKTTRPCKIKLELFEKNKEGVVDMIKTFDRYDTIHEVPVLGLYDRYKNKLCISFLDKNSKVLLTDTVTIKTNEGIGPKWEVSISDSPQPVKNYFLHNTFQEEAYIYDRKGEVRGYYKGAMLRRRSNGNYLYVKGKKTIVEITPMGKEVKNYTLPDAYSRIHHELYELPNGNIMVGADKNPPGNPPDVRDIVIELNRADRSVVHVWNMENFIEMSRAPERLYKKNNTVLESWFHVNAVIYDPNDDALIFSGRHQGIIKIGYKDKKLKWFFTPHIGFDRQGTDSIDYLLTAVDKKGKPYGEAIQSGVENTAEDGSTFFWPVRQHSPLIIPSDDGLLHLLVFNNDAIMTPEKKSLMIEYVIDEKKKTVSQYRVFDHAFYSRKKSGVDYHAKQVHYLMYGTSKPSVLSEFDYKGNIIFQTESFSPGYRVHYLESLY